MNIPALSAESLALASLTKYRHIVSARAFRDAARIMAHELAVDVDAALSVLDGCDISRLMPDVIEWLNALATAILGRDCLALAA